MLFDAELTAADGVDLQADRADLFLDLAAIAAGERDGDAVRAVEISEGRLQIQGVHARPGAALELTAISGRAESGRGIDAHAALSPRGSVTLRTQSGEKPFETTLDVTIDDAEASALAPWLAALRVGAGPAGGFRIEAGRLDGRVELSGAMVPTERAYAELALSGLSASLDEATLRGDAALTVDLGGLRATPSGVFALDAQNAEVTSGLLHKASGQPFTLSGVLAPRSDGAPGFAVERVRAAPLALDLDLGRGVPVRVRIGDRSSQAPDAAPDTEGPAGAPGNAR